MPIFFSRHKTFSPSNTSFCKPQIFFFLINLLKRSDLAAPLCSFFFLFPTAMMPASRLSFVSLRFSLPFKFVIGPFSLRFPACRELERTAAARTSGFFFSPLFSEPPYFLQKKMYSEGREIYLLGSSKTSQAIPSPFSSQEGRCASAVALFHPPYLPPPRFSF